MDLTVTGDVRLNLGAPADVVLGDVDITVAAGGTLRAEGLRTRVTDPPPEGSNQAGTHPVTLSVAGELYLARSTIASIGASVEGGLPTDKTLVVAPGGRAVLNTSVLVGGQHAVVNDGALTSFASSLYSLLSAQLVTNQGATSQYARTGFNTMDPAVRVFFRASARAPSSPSVATPLSAWAVRSIVRTTSAWSSATASTSVRCRCHGRRDLRSSTRSRLARCSAPPPPPISTVRPGVSTATAMVPTGAMSAPPNTNLDGCVSSA
jgi:hypothetical protein